MTDNHPTAPAPPGLSAIEQIVADLSAKYQVEKKHENELERQLADSRSRCLNLDTVISSLRREYGLPEPPKTQSLDDDKAPDGKEVVEDKPNTLLIVGKPVETSKINGKAVLWSRPANLSWLELVRNAIKDSNEMVSINEIATIVGMDEAAKNMYNQTLSGTLATYRKTGQLVGIATYYKTSKGAAFSQNFTGLPAFFSDIENKVLKPEYHSLFMLKLQKYGLYLSEKEAMNSQ